MRHTYWHLAPPWWAFETADGDWGVRMAMTTWMSAITDAQWFTMEVKYD